MTTFEAETLQLGADCRSAGVDLDGDLRRRLAAGPQGFQLRSGRGCSEADRECQVLGVLPEARVRGCQGSFLTQS